MLLVIMMNIYKDLPRLRATEKTGQRHISVRRQAYLSYPQHWHDYFEIEIVISGSAEHYYNGTAYNIAKGDCYLLTPVDFHRIETETPIELINISFDSVWLSEDMQLRLYTLDVAKKRKLSEDEYKRLVTVAELLQKECDEDGPCIKQLLEYILSRIIPPKLSAKATGSSSTQLNGIMNAVAYIEQHFREKITLDMLSKISGYHPAYFSNLFCKVVGETYIERLTSLRINYAKMLLKKGVSVSEACFASGFGSLSNFSAVFKKKSGMSPNDYRNSKKN